MVGVETTAEMVVRLYEAAEERYEGGRLFTDPYDAVMLTEEEYGRLQSLKGEALFEGNTRSWYVAMHRDWPELRVVW